MPELVRDFLDPAEFFQQVKNICGINFFCGVPDSLLKGMFTKFRTRSIFLLIYFRLLCLCNSQCSIK